MKLRFQLLKSKSNKHNYVIFCDHKFKAPSLNKIFSSQNSKVLNRHILNNKSKEKNIFLFNLNENQKVIIVNVNSPELGLENEKIGAEFYEYIKSNSLNDLGFFDTNISFFNFKNSSFIYEFFHGLKLKSYSFEKYKTKPDNKIFNFYISEKLKKEIEKANSRLSSILSGVNLTKDLVSEPGNVLHPDEYVNRIKSLSSFGLKINVLDQKKLKKLGMNALIGVGQGSIRGSYLVTIEWNGSTKKQRPLSFVGKGVCFDTGGISLKPAKFMEDMTYDMAGSAVVVGLMKTLALRKAKVNAVGVVGLVENMPDGNAQRPGDIVKSFSGKTIEILNTDAEGRLVLADALTYTERKFKPQFIIDLATLTGAIIVSLGSEYAGLFSNDDKISEKLFKAGEKVGEKVWRMPLNKNYDKLINSKKADMQNINYVGGAGSITAAQFLQRFILDKTPWAHLDIAGMAFSKYGGALNSDGATGYGVRLLNKLIEDNYE